MLCWFQHWATNLSSLIINYCMYLEFFHNLQGIKDEKRRFEQKWSPLIMPFGRWWGSTGKNPSPLLTTYATWASYQSLCICLSNHKTVDIISCRSFARIRNSTIWKFPWKVFGTCGNSTHFSSLGFVATTWFCRFSVKEVIDNTWINEYGCGPVKFYGH